MQAAIPIGKTIQHSQKNVVQECVIYVGISLNLAGMVTT